MSMTTCNECRQPISNQATACPHCGAAIRRTSLLTWVVTIFIGVTAFASLNAYMRQTSAPAHEPMTDAQRLEKTRNEVRFTRTAIAAATLKESLREPESLIWRSILADEDATTVCLEYRARNGFGGMTIEHAVFYGDTASQKAEDWNRHCTGRELYDMKAVQYALN